MDPIDVFTVDTNYEKDDDDIQDVQNKLLRASYSLLNMLSTSRNEYFKKIFLEKYNHFLDLVKQAVPDLLELIGKVYFSVGNLENMVKANTKRIISDGSEMMDLAYKLRYIGDEIDYNSVVIDLPALEMSTIIRDSMKFVYHSIKTTCQQISTPDVSFSTASKTIHDKIKFGIILKMLKLNIDKLFFVSCSQNDWIAIDIYTLAVKFDLQKIINELKQSITKQCSFTWNLKSDQLSKENSNKRKGKYVAEASLKSPLLARIKNPQT